MAKHITILVPGKHPQTGKHTTFELKDQRIDIGGQAVPFLIHGVHRHLAHPHPKRLSHCAARWLAHRALGRP